MDGSVFLMTVDSTLVVPRGTEPNANLVELAVKTRPRPLPLTRRCSAASVVVDEYAATSPGSPEVGTTPTVRNAAVDPGVVGAYSTCTVQLSPGSSFRASGTAPPYWTQSPSSLAPRRSRNWPGE